MSRGRGWPGWYVVLGLVSACFAPIPDPGPPETERVQAPTDSDRFQALLEHYCVFGHERNVVTSHAETCLFDLDFNALRARRAVEAGRLAIDPNALARCLASEDVPSFDLPSFDPPASEGACAEVWIPRGKAGDACDTHLTCPSDHYCARSVWGRSAPHYVAGACGVCRPRGALGAACVATGWSESDVQCAAGLSCDITTGSCVQAAAPCDSHEDCSRGFHCSSGGCLPRGTLVQGDACTIYWDCAEGNCVAAACSDESCSRVCGPAVPDGQECTYSSDCGSTSFCSAVPSFPSQSESDAPGSIPPVWHWECAPTAEGTPCSADYTCADGLVCASTTKESVCAKPVEEGSSCLSTAQCPTSFTCLDDHCVGRVSPGDSCLGNEQCPLPFDCVEGRCRGHAKVGAACDGSDAFGRTTCEHGSDCREGICQRWAEYGEPCTGGCIKGSCLEGRCRTPPAGSALEAGQYGVDPCGDLTLGPERTCVDEIPDGSSCAAQAYDGCGFGSSCSDALVCAAICVL